MKTWYELVRAAMTTQNISQEQMAERLGVTQGAVGHWLNGKREPKLETINRLLAEVGLPPMAVPQGESVELEPGPEFSKRFKRAKVLGVAQLGPNGFWDVLEHAGDWVEVPSCDPGVYALRVKGDSMAPAIRNGWLVWCEPNHQLIPGKYVMVRRTNGECMIKELLYENAEEVSLMSVNDGYGRINIPRSEIEQIHYVAGLMP